MKTINSFYYGCSKAFTVGFKWVQVLLVVLFLFLAGNAQAQYTVKTRVSGAANWSAPTTWIKLCTGSASITLNSTAVTGTGTLFLTEIQVGDVVMMDGDPTTTTTVASITSNTAMTLALASNQSASNVVFGKQAVPGPLDNVQIGNSFVPTAGITLTLDVASATVNSLTFGTCAFANTLTHTLTNTLTVTNNVVLNQPTALATSGWFINAAAVTVGGSVTFNDTSATAGLISKIAVTTGTLSIGGSLVYNQAATVPAANAVMDLSGGAATMNVGGSLTLTGAGLSGTLAQSATSTVVFNGSGAQSIADGSALDYNHVRINKTAGTATLTAPITLTGNFLISQGTFSTGNFDMTVPGSWTNNGTFTPGTGTVNFTGTTAQVISGTAATQPFYNLVIAKTAGTGLTFGAGITGLTANNLTLTTGNFTPPATADYNGSILLTTGTYTSGSTMNVAGNWTNNGGTFTHSGGTVTFDGGAAQAIGGTAATSFNNLTIMNVAAAVSVNVNTNVAGTLLLNGAATVLSPAAAVVINTAAAAGTLTGTGTIRVSRIAATADLLNQYKFTTTTVTGLTADYNGAGAQTVNALNYAGLTISTNGTRTVTLAASGTIGVSGVFNPTATTTTYTATGSTINMNGGGAQAIPAFTFNNLTTSNAGTKTTTGNIVVNGTLTVTSPTILSAGAAFTVAGTGTLTGTGTVQVTRITATADFATQYPITTKTLTTLTVDYNGAGAQTVNALNYSNLTISLNGTRTVTLAGAGTIGVSGVFTPAAGTTSYTITGSTVDFNSAGAQSIPVFTYNGLSVSGSGTTKTASGALVVNGVLTVNTGAILYMGAFALSGSLTSTSGTGIVRTQNTTATPLPAGKTWTGTVDYNVATGGQTIVAGTYAALTLSNTSGTNTAGGAIAVGGVLTLPAGTVLNMTTFALSGALTVTGTGILRTQSTTVPAVSAGVSWPGTVEYNNATGGQTVAAGTYVNLTNSNTSGTNTAGGAIAVSGSLVLNASSVLSMSTFALSGALSTISGTGALKTANITTTPIPAGEIWPGTVEYNSATGAQSIVSGTYANLVNSNTSGANTATGILTITNFTSTGGAFAGGAFTHLLSGNWSMASGTFTNTGTTITLNGTGAQTILSTGAFNNLTINKASGSTTLSGSITVAGTLTFTLGKIITGSNTLTLSGSATGAGQLTGWVIGNLQRNFAAGTLSGTFDIGGNNYYSPLALTFAAVTTAGGITAKVTESAHPNMSTSGFDATKNIPRYWTVTNSGGVVYSSYTASLTWNSAENYSGLSTSLLKMGKYTAAAWSVPTITGTPSTTNLQANGISTAGDFIVGEAPTHFYVNDNATTGDVYTSAVGNDLNTGTAAAPFLTINKAITVAHTGDTVYVDAGTFGEQVNASKSITLLGANAAISPNTGSRVGETILNNSSNNSITITNTGRVVIKGFKITATFTTSVIANTTNTRVTLEKNLFQGSKGIYFNAPDSVLVIDNRLTGLDTSSNAEGIFVTGSYNGTTGSYMEVYNNTWINNLKTSGMNLGGVQGSIYNNTFSNVAYYGILVANYSSLNITRNTFTGITNPDVSVTTYGAGVRFYTPTAGMTTTVTNNFFTGSYIGVSVRAAGGDLTGTNITVSNNSFSGNTFANINHAGTGKLDATCNWFGSTVQTTVGNTIMGNVRYLHYLTSGTDNDLVTAGFQPAAGTCGGGNRLYVNDNATTGDIYTTSVGSDANGGIPAYPFLTINYALAVANAGDTIYVDAGTYGEQVVAGKLVTILGANAAISPNTGTRGTESILSSATGNAVSVTTTGRVVVKGFRMTAAAAASVLANTASSKVTLEKNFFDCSQGIYFNLPDSILLADNRFNNIAATTEGVFVIGSYNGSTGTQLQAYNNTWINGQFTGMNVSNAKGDIYNNTFSGIAYYGILAASYSSLNITRNTFTGITNPDTTNKTWGAGIRIYTPTAGMTTSVTNNYFTNCYVGLGVRTPAGDLTGCFFSASNNSFSGNTYAAINHAGTGQMDATCNWFGSVSQAVVAPSVMGPVMYVHYLTSGIDNDAVTAGFQPAAGTCTGPTVFYVNDNATTGDVYTTAVGNDANVGSTSAPFLTINKAITIANAGDTIYVDAGSYGEQVAANKKITLLGANAAISPNGGIRNAESILNNSSNNAVTVTTTSRVVIKGFRITAASVTSVISNTTSNKVTLEKNFFDGSRGLSFNLPDSLSFIDNRLNNITATTEGLLISGSYNGATGTWMEAYNNTWINGSFTGVNVSSARGDIYNNTFNGIAYYGILVANYSSLNITRNTFTGITNPDTTVSSYGSGVRFYTPTAGMTTTVTNNFFTNNYVGVAVRTPGGNLAGTNITVTNNSFTGNTFANINHPGTGTLSAPCNWYGTTDTALWKITGPVTALPMGTNGTDYDAVTAGFQPYPSTCADMVTWTGNTSTDWNTASNWSSNAVPTIASYAIIPTTPAGGRMPLVAAGTPVVNLLSIKTGATLTQTGGTLNCQQTTSITGTFNQSAGTYLAGSTITVNAGGAINVSGTGNLHLDNAAVTTATNSIVLAANASMTQSGGTVQVLDLTINATNSAYTQTGGTLQLARDYINYGAFNATAGTIEWMGTAVSPVFSGTNQFYHVLVDPSMNAGVTAGSSISVKGNYTATTYTQPATATTTFNGSGSQSITGVSSAAATFGHLVINNPTSTITLLSNANVAGNTTVTSGTYDLYVFTSNRTTAGGTFTVSAGANVVLGGASGGQAGSNFPLNFSANSLAATSLILYNGTGSITQTIYGAAYGHVTLTNGTGAGTANKISNGNFSVAGNLTVNTGVLFTPAAADIISGTGALTGAGTARVTRIAATADLNTQYTIASKVLTSLTIDYFATLPQTVNALNYSNLTVSGARTTSSVTFASSGTIGVSGVFLPSATFTTGAPVMTGSTIDFNGSGAQNIPAFTYNSLSASGSGATKTATGNLVVNGTFTVNSNVILNMGTLLLSGTMTGVAGTGTLRTQNTTSAPIPTGKTWTGTVEYNNAAGGQTISAGTYNALTNAAGTNTAGGALTVNSSLNIVVSTLLSMGANALGGTLTAITGTGTLKTQNTSTTPIPAGKTWTGTVEYQNASGGQTVVGGTYTNLTNSNTSGTNTCTAALSVSGTLLLNTLSTLDLGAFALTGAVATISGTGALKTQNTGATPLPTGKTWTGGIEYNNATGGQTIVAGSYNNLTSSNASGTNTASSNLSVTGTLTLNNAGTFAVAGSGTNTVKNVAINTGTLSLSGTSLQIGGTITATGTIAATTGSIEMTGTSAQVIPAALFTGNQLKNLTITNTSGVTLAGTLLLSGILKAATGNLATGGYLTLLSTSAQTALIDGTGAGQVTGNLTMQRYLPSGFGYKYLSAPFQAATISQLSNEVNLAATFPAVYRYDENLTTSGWVSYTDSTYTMSPFTGYACNLGAVTAPKTVDITGVVNNGTVNTLTLYNHNRTYTLGFNLAGNPYPSPIDWNVSGGWTRTNVDNAIYYFNAGSTSQYTGTYSSYINGISSDGIANNIIPSMQGFFVHVSSGSFPVSGSLSVNNNARINNLTPYFHRQTGVEDRPLIRMSARYEDGQLSSDPAVVYFENVATPGFDRDADALKMLNTDERVPSLYTLSPDAARLSINGLPVPMDSDVVIPMGIETGRDGMVILKAADIERLPQGLHLYLADKATGLTQDMEQAPEYRRQLEKGRYENRFFLVFSRQSAISIPGSEAAMLNAYYKDKRLFVYLAAEAGGLTVTNALGQVVARETLSGNGYHEIGIDVSSGIYMVTLTSGGVPQTRKVFIGDK